ncbi:hypothetical protein DY000_02021107 [Brassica cretica]|uniref:Uncharacterized protein n=1 Tax=Brassica cretica TaxID=69181 RepID=A0ABQ7EBK5_BRACR|nr:hypothetical protein DY000_02021107 [Brassica cretica]
MKESDQTSSPLEISMLSGFDNDEEVVFCMHESLLGIGVPHGILGDIWVRLELKRGDKGDHWTSSAWERLYRSDAMNSLYPTSQSDLTRAETRVRSPFSLRSDLLERQGEVAPAPERPHHSDTQRLLGVVSI